MTEQLQDVNAQAKAVPPTGTPETLTPEQFVSIKTSLIQTLQKNYMDFVNSIQHFPLHQAPMQEAFKHFDTGFLWFKEAIATMPMPIVQAAQAPQPQAPSEQTMAQTNAEAPPASNEAMPEEVA
jgi:hypothetical protein